MTTRTQAIASAHQLLVREFGEQLKTSRGEDVVIVDDRVAEHENAWAVPFNTRSFLEGGPPTNALVPSVIIVPKNGARSHYAPTALRVSDYLEKVRSGDMPWSAEPEA